MAVLDEKVKRVFGEYAVDKRLARSGSISRLPSFIGEFLITKFCAGKGAGCVEDASRRVSELYPEPSSRELFLGRLKERGSVKLLDEFRVRVDLKRNLLLLQVPSLAINDALVNEEIVKSNERLYSGLWGLGVLYYEPGIASDLRGVTPVVMEDFEPFQAYRIDLDLFIEARESFTLEEWLDVLATSMGLNPAAYSLKQKLFLVTRLVPLSTANVNLLELGPRATGKTFTYRNLTYYSRIHSGGVVSPARLFYDVRSNIPGDLVVNDVVVFDEVARIKFTNSDEIVGKLKDYMVDGYFERGPFHPRKPSTCSLVFLGNVDLERASSARGIISYLPAFMRDTAFLDRIHGFIHGWELPKIMSSDEHLAQGYGIASDYLAEVMHQMKGLDWEQEVSEIFEFQGGVTIRDEKALRKLLSGALKLLFPNREYDRSELAAVAEPLVGLRNNVIQLLSALSPGEFPEKKIKVFVRG